MVCELASIEKGKDCRMGSNGILRFRDRVCVLGD